MNVYDFDGTIYNGTEVPEITKKAIERFMDEGGSFCICTGRGPEFLKEMSHFIRGNTYSICFGGALITDIWTGEVLHEGFVDPDVKNVLDDILTSDAETVRINVMRQGGIIDHYTTEEYKTTFPNISEKAYKVTLNGKSERDGALYVEFAKAHPNDKYTLARSFSSYIEILKTQNTKGNGAKLLKERLGAKLLVGMGDYENDFELFKAADISFAVANAIPELKAIATHTLSRSVNEGAAVEVIEFLEKNR